MKKFHKYLYNIASKEFESTLPQQKEVSWATEELYLSVIYAISEPVSFKFLWIDGSVSSI